MTTTKRTFLKTLTGAAVALGIAAVAPFNVSAAEKPDTVTVDYAYYNPVALLLKKKGWLEEEFAKDDIDVRWLLSLGSNKALEFLNGGSADFASTAGSAAVVGRANGIPIKAVYVYSKPEWTALVTKPDSGIETVADLKGKSVAVTRGTDPHIFLLRALAAEGLSESDIKTVLLQHPDGYLALEKGQVDAWAGLDPHMAKAELESGAKLFFRAPDLNTYGILNVREAFADEHPDLVTRVLRIYERTRRYALEHPEELREVLVEAARLTDEVADKQLSERTDITNPVIGAEHRTTFLETAKVLQGIGVLKPEVNVEQVVDDLIDSSFIVNLAAK
ncbi:aliphatic sulfonate ABC transporter substrate-binding protein [Limibacillus sp. MBR-115]|uniref:aliphatic sulfonate ABC transporter substrate-binding protein n=1 Tax=Limibacillus sp. MBR-115 TaxID=3156465 RepID=UPI00339743FA